MFEIKRELITRWTEPKSNQARMPINIDVDCPKCGRSLVNYKLDFSQGYNNEIYHARIMCSACESLAHFFLVNWLPKDDFESLNARIFIDPSPKPNLNLPIEVDLQKVSPRFVTIYLQSFLAKQMGYDELVGMGYRKALEFLLKDYLIAIRPDDATAIQTAWLGNCIKDYVQDPMVKKAAQKSAMLGNDETHYERRDASSDIGDLERLMAVTIRWISGYLMTREL